jgi:hypothetical protein
MRCTTNKKIKTSAKHLAFILMLGAVFMSYATAQVLETPERGASTTKASWRVAAATNDRIESGSFRSVSGGFSLAIPEMPFETREYGSELAKAKGVDAGKLYLWKFGKTIYTAFYSPPVNKDGDPLPESLSSMESGSRRGISSGGGTLVAERAIKFGNNPGTEFRYVSADGIKFISRLYLIGSVGYQIVGGYSDDQDEAKVIEILNSFSLKSR